MENNVNKWFDAARHNPPMITIEEVGAMISNPPASRGGLSTLKKLIFMGTVLTCIISGLIWFNQAGTSDKITTKPQQVVREGNVIVKKQEDAVVIPIVRSNQKPNDKMQFFPVQKTEENEKTPAFQFSPPIEMSGPAVPNQSTSSGGFEEIVLTNEELLRLGIRTDGNILNYLNQYDTWSSKLTTDDYVLAMVIEISKSGDIRSNNAHLNDSVLAKYSNPAVPLLITRLPTHDDDDKGSFWILNKHVPVTKHTVFVSDMIEKLVPVVVHTKGRGIKYVHDNTLVFWYKNNEVFRQQLPGTYKAKLEQKENFSEESLTTFIENLTGEENREDELYKLSDEQLKNKQKEFIVLSNKELKKLNIRFDGKSLTYKTLAPGKDSGVFLVRIDANPNDQMMSFAGQSGKKYHANAALLSAWYATDSNVSIITNFIDPVGSPGDQEAREERMRNEQKLLNQRIDHLIPILVRFSPDAVKRATNKHPITHLVFWFPENEALIKALPERIRREKIHRSTGN
jgi:hypothetical protein